jgi:hypothetical protein
MAPDILNPRLVYIHIDIDLGSCLERNYHIKFLKWCEENYIYNFSINDINYVLEIGMGASMQCTLLFDNVEEAVHFKLVHG